MHVNNILKVISIRLDSRFPVAIVAQDPDLELPPDVDGPMDPDLELPPDDDGPELPDNDAAGLCRWAFELKKRSLSGGSEPATKRKLWPLKKKQFFLIKQ